MIYAVILLSLVAIYQHFRINYVRNSQIELTKKSYDKLYQEFLHFRNQIVSMSDDQEQGLRHWCIEQAVSLNAGDVISQAEKIEKYILSIDKDKEFKEQMRNK